MPLTYRLLMFLLFIRNQTTIEVFGLHNGLHKAPKNNRKTKV